VLAREAVLTAPELREPFELIECVERVRHYAFTAAWTFSQSFRNFSRPLVVSG
jgi:hypothetical protein